MITDCTLYVESSTPKPPKSYMNTKKRTHKATGQNPFRNRVNKSIGAIGVELSTYNVQSVIIPDNQIY